LDDHHRHVVCDHIVQLTGDPAPLDRDRRLRLQLSLLAELAVGRFQRRVLPAPAADTAPDHPRRQQPDVGRNGVAGILAVQNRRDKDRNGRHRQHVLASVYLLRQSWRRPAPAVRTEATVGV